MNVFSLLITTPLGYVISAIYMLVKNYGLAIIFFTIITKLLLLPLNVKQQKSMQRQQKLMPLVKKLNEKYKDDKTKLNQETMKLYSEHKINPAGGCLPLLVQFPILIGLYQVITKPLSYILHLNNDVIEKIGEIVGFEGTRTALQDQINVAVSMNNNIDQINSQLGLALYRIDFNFLGLDLASIPKLSVISVLWIIPILAAFTAWLQIFIQSKISGGAMQDNQTAKTMNNIMPLMSGYFCFIMPAGVGLYWIASNAVQIVQTYFINKTMKGKNEEVKPLELSGREPKKIKKRGKNR